MNIKTKSDEELSKIEREITAEKKKRKDEADKVFKLKALHFAEFVYDNRDEFLNVLEHNPWGKCNDNNTDIDSCTRCKLIELEKWKIDADAVIMYFNEDELVIKDL